MRPKSGHGRLEMIRHIFCKYYLGGKWRMDWKWKWKSLSHVQLFVTPWTRPWNYTGQNVGVGSLSLLQGIFPTQRPNPGLPHCRLILFFFFLQADSLPAEPQGKPKHTGMGSLSLHQRIFLTQESNQDLLNCSKFFTNWTIRRMDWNGWNSVGSKRYKGP